MYSLNDEIAFLTEAYKFAKVNSTDPSTQLGAVIVKDGLIISYGANHFPRNIAESKERWERPLKYSYVEHAERNVIYHAAKHGIALENTVMYCPWFACDNCARAIIQSGIKEVVGMTKPNDLTPSHWQESIKIAWDMLQEAGIKLRWLNIITGVNVRFNGTVVEM